MSRREHTGKKTWQTTGKKGTKKKDSQKKKDGGTKRGKWAAEKNPTREREKQSIPLKGKKC